ncbi:unnamed protein product [Ectocarpus sp. 4 AP-2014]
MKPPLNKCSSATCARSTRTLGMEEVQELDEEAPEKEATDRDAYRWNNRGLQDAMSRAVKAILEYLPTITGDGRLLPPGTRGRGSDNVRSPRLKAAAFKRRFPNSPVCKPLESVETRAIEAMQPSAATGAMQERAKKDEDLGHRLREAAMATFATVDVEIALYVHEVVFFEELVRDDRFKVNTRGGAGVRMICPGCKSNKFVKPPGVSGHGFPCMGAKLRVAHDVAGVVVPVTGRYACLGPGCPLRLESAKRSAARKKDVVADDGWDEDTINKHCPNGVSFNTMDESEQQEIERKAGRGPTSWPAWKFNRSSITATPSVTVLNTIYAAGHEEDKGHMHRELHSLVDGQFVNADGSYRLVGRVNHDAQCLYSLMGEDAKIHAYGALKSESKVETFALYTRYAERRRRSGTLTTLQWIIDDLCCRGAKDVNQHFLMNLFPGMVRRPLGDAFHMTQVQ